MHNPSSNPIVAYDMSSAAHAGLTTAQLAVHALSWESDATQPARPGTPSVAAPRALASTSHTRQRAAQQAPVSSAAAQPPQSPAASSLSLSPLARLPPSGSQAGALGGAPLQDRSQRAGGPGLQCVLAAFVPVLSGRHTCSLRSDVYADLAEPSQHVAHGTRQAGGHSSCARICEVFSNPGRHLAMKPECTSC